MVWLDVWSKSLTALVTLDKGTVDHSCYIKNVLPIALKYENEVFGDKWSFQQDGVNPHRDYLTQEWCRNSFPLLIDKGCWSQNSPHLNPLNYSIWDELINIID